MTVQCLKTAPRQTKPPKQTEHLDRIATELHRQVSLKYKMMAFAVTAKIIQIFHFNEIITLSI